jgi:hypothetical protein
VPYERDPVSVLWDTAAKALLARAQAAGGGWQGTRAADPSGRQRAMCLAIGINPNAADSPSAAAGKARRGHGLNAKTRWVRGLARAIWHANDSRHGGPGLPLRLEVGRWKPAGVTVPPGYAVRLRVHRGGSGAAVRAAEAKPDSERIWTGDGQPGPRWSDPARRDWA